MKILNDVEPRIIRNVRRFELRNILQEVGIDFYNVECTEITRKFV